MLLSQFLQGLANGYADSEKESGTNPSEIDLESLCEGLSRGTDVAYSAVSVPVEGTMLTVMRSVSDKAWQSYQTKHNDLVSILEDSVRAADNTLQETPTMLDKLREAGVVDAGGQGVVVIMDALREYFSVDGYKGLVEVESLTIRQVEAVSPLQWHVDPGAEDVKVDDMDQQYTDAQTVAPVVSQEVGVVAIAWGSGIVELFQGMGVGVVICGDTMNPSTQEIITAIKELGAQNTIILPNNPNVILTAKQVISQLGSTVKVIETTTIPSGVSAALNYDAAVDMEANIQTMSTSFIQVKSGSITRSVRDIVIDGIECATGDIIGLLDDKIIVAGKTEYLSLSN